MTQQVKPLSRMALGGLQEVVDQYVDADVVTDELREVTLKKVIEALDEKRMELLDIVVHLEKVMCDASNPTGRRNAIQFLAFCLRDKAELKLNFKHVETFAKFFENKLSDWQCVEGAVLGIFVLLKRQAALIRTLKHETEKGEVPLAVHLAQQMLKEVHVPSHTQAVRKSVLDTILLLAEDWHDELTMIGPHLGDGIAAAIEEERDPRNLLASFKVVRKVMADFPAASVSREAVTALFDTLSSYFPITFQPPKGDKIGITGDDLREALSQAFCASPRFTDLVVPFLLDASKDIEADVDATVAQAMNTLVFCLEKTSLGSSAAQKHLKDILATARDQVCRTKTTCARDFCRCVVESLKIAMKGVPAGLHPSWVAKDVVPELKEMAEDASKGRMSLASDGARQLLLAAAASHPVIYEYVWSAVMAAFLEDDAKGFSADALTFMEDMLQLRQEGVLSSKQLQPALSGALTTLRSLTPTPAEAEAEPAKALVAAVGLVKRLALAAPEAPSAAEALGALQSALLGGSSSSAWAIWAQQWQKELSSKTYSNECISALVTAVCDLLPTQLERTRSMAPLLLKFGITEMAQWVPLTLPRLLAFAAQSLAGSEATAATAQDTELSHALLKRAAEVFQSQDANGHKETLLAFADALDRGGKSFAMALAKALGLPSSVPHIAAGLTTDRCEGSLPSVDIILERAEASRRFLRSLMRHLPPDQAKAMQRRLLEFVALNSREPLANCIGLLPGILPDACVHSWTFCRKTMAAVCRCASGADPDLANSPGAAGAETLALEALEALVESCPKEEVPILLENFRDTFGKLLRGGQAALTEKEGLGATLCWASVTAALLRRDNAQQQAAAFLEALLSALDQEAPVGPFVPMAFRVLAPVKVESAKASRAKLPPLALQQLSRTVLPSLIARTKGVKAVQTAAWAKRAALESAVALLAGLSPEVACNDCSEELRFCTLTSLKRLKEDPEATVFAAQVLQLLVRAIQKQQSWVEDDLHSVVTPICELCSSHRVPLVRLGCFQVLIALIQQAFGHLAPFKKQIQAGCKNGVEDRCREVRLLAVAALNTWHCVGSQ